MTPSSDEPQKDGGAAFPVPIGSQHYAGISQRKYFAGQALTGLLAGKRNRKNY